MADNRVIACTGHAIESRGPLHGIMDAARENPATWTATDRDVSKAATTATTNCPPIVFNGFR